MAGLFRRWLSGLLGMQKCIVCHRNPVTIKRVWYGNLSAYACLAHEADAREILKIIRGSHEQ